MQIVHSGEESGFVFHVFKGHDGLHHAFAPNLIGCERRSHETPEGAASAMREAIQNQLNGWQPGGFPHGGAK